MPRQQSFDGLTICFTVLIITSRSVLAASNHTVNIAKLANFTVSSTLSWEGHDYKMENVVDGKVDTTSNGADSCSCCFVSGRENNPNFTARFSGHYHVHRITIVGRQDGGGNTQKLFGINVFLDNQNTTVTLNTNTNTATVIPLSPSVQTIEISRPHSQPNSTWNLVICDLRVLVSGINVAKQASLSASQVLSYDGYNYSKENAVDGKVEADPNRCSCCYSSHLTTDPFFTAVFDRQYNIVDIVIEGRQDSPDADSVLSGVGVQTDGTSEEVNIEPSSMRAYVSPYPPLQNITILRPNSSSPWYLMICELRIFIAECAEGYFGDRCDSHCPQNCDGACDSQTGRCTHGCVAGFRGDTCNTPCPGGTFGHNCSRLCHCKDNQPCNTSTGICGNGCAAGWTGPTCSQACPDGRFGHDCVHDCLCMNNVTCDKALGNCSNGCDYGRSGFNCSIDHNLLSVIKNNVTTSMSSIYLGFGPTLATDGSYDLMSPSFDACNCCSATTGAEIPWWRIDLGRQFLVREIYIIGRQIDNQKQSKNLLTSISNTSAVGETNGTLLANVSQTGTVYHYNYSDPKLFRYLTVKRNTTTVMTVCEVKLIEGDCSNGTFGDGCGHTCHCLDGQPCDKISGRCQTLGCKPGWKGEACDQVCPKGTFGKNCSVKCNCLDGTNCNNINGKCDNHLCAPGWRADSCSQVCMHGTFGFNCAFECHCLSNNSCNNVIGTCDNGICAPGWQNESCSEVCDYRTFGMNCSTVCHCFNGTCNNVDGKCHVDKCEDGYTSETCSKECAHGTFGNGCNFTCHCLNDIDCLKANGTCSSGLCEAGWQGATCSEVCDYRTFGMNCSTVCHCFNGTCNNVDGKCHVDKCEDGYTSETCSKECAHGTFGNGCNFTCHCLNDIDCLKANGTCSSGLCEAGWQGTTCSEECAHGTFGFDCNSRCHCLNDLSCLKENGTCSNGLCEAGWRGTTCSEGCENGAFGQNCSQVCHCFNRTACHGLYGTCTVGQCDPGYTGASCSQPLEASSEDGKSSGAAIGAGVAAALVVIAVVIAVAIFLKRRNRARADKGETRSFEKLDDVPVIERRNHMSDAAEPKENKAFEGETNDYYSFTPIEGDVTLAQLWHYIRKHQQNENQLFSEEFKTLPYGLVLPCTEAQKPTNKKKNRYRDMYAYDHSRVILETHGPDETDYINACHVNGNGRPKKFIASQGPMGAMVNDFWRMVWQQRVNKIVMLTNPMEVGAVKCIQYWPEDGEGQDVYGDIQIRLVGSESFPDYIRRDFTIELDGSERSITQFHFKSWPDKDVPDNTWCLVNFWRAVNNDHSTSQDAPFVVHCSAGVGRTGTYIALDILYDQMKEEGNILPLQTVRTLREQRVNMVQTKEQYAFLHEAVADALGIGTHFVFSSQFPDVHRFLSEREPGSTRTRFADQFDMVLDILRNHSEPESPPDEAEYANTATSTEIDAYRPKLRKRSSKNVQEMGAMYLPNYNGTNTYLVGKSPTEKSLVEFWSLVQEENVKTIISLCEPAAKGYKTSSTLGADTVTPSSHFAISMVTESRQKAFTERTFQYNENGQTGSEHQRMVKVFDFTAWKSGYDTPGDAESMVDFIEAISAWQPHISESQPVLLHCGTGSRRCGVVCLILSELNRLKREDGQINVLDSLIKIKQRNKDMVTSEGQYRFCHDVILSYIGYQQRQNQGHFDDHHIYANA